MRTITAIIPVHAGSTRLKNKNVDLPPHKQECYSKETWNIPQLSLPITERLADEELSLPIGPAITLEEVAEVVRLINEFKF